MVGVGHYHKYNYSGYGKQKQTNEFLMFIGYAC